MNDKIHLVMLLNCSIHTSEGLANTQVFSWSYRTRGYNDPLPRRTMLILKPGERAYLTEIRALTSDQDGNELLVGLTAKESVWYHNYVQASFSGTVDR